MAKRFGDKITLIMGTLKGDLDICPRHVTSPYWATIVLTIMKVFEERSGLFDGFAESLFFYIPIEGIEEEVEVFYIDPIDGCIRISNEERLHIFEFLRKLNERITIHTQHIREEGGDRIEITAPEHEYDA